VLAGRDPHRHRPRRIGGGLPRLAAVRPNRAVRLPTGRSTWNPAGAVRRRSRALVAVRGRTDR
jgi:hypothetical protein